MEDDYRNYIMAEDPIIQQFILKERRKMQENGFTSALPTFLYLIWKLSNAEAVGYMDQPTC